MINNVVLVGRLTKDIELKYTQSNKVVTSFILAVNRSFKDADGERQADFIQCQAWGKTAEILHRYTHKGSQIGVTGRINTRNYDNQQGQRIYVTEVIVDGMTLLDSREQSNQQNQYNQQQQPAFSNPPQNNNYSQASTPPPISDDDLPF